MGRVRSVFSGVVRRPEGLRRYVVFLLVFVLILVVVNLATWRVYAGARGALERELGERLKAIATVAAQGVDAGYVDEIAAAPEEDLSAFIVRTRFEELQRRIDVGNVVLLDPHGTTVLDLGRTAPRGSSHPLAALHAEPFTVARSGIASSSELYTSLGAHYMNGYAPVLDLDEEPVGVVAVEAGAEFFDALAGVRQVALVVSVASVVTIVLLAAIFFRILRLQVRLDETMRRTETLSLMGEMAASVAHEIKNPLGIIRATGERLRKRHGTGEEIFDYIPDEVDRLNAILTAYLDFARQGAGQAGGTCDPAAVTEAVLRLTRRDLEMAGIELVTDLRPGPAAAIDAGSLQQALLNLILNARHAMPEGGRLSIDLDRERDAVRISVHDTGVGIAPEDLDRIFQPFFSGRERGSGLGLAITQRVVRSAGGRIEVESEPGRGSRFTMRVPIADNGDGTLGPEAR